MKKRDAVKFETPHLKGTGVILEIGIRTIVLLVTEAFFIGWHDTEAMNGYQLTVYPEWITV